MKMDAITLLDIQGMIEKCKNGRDFERRFKILLLINSRLPYTKRLHVPSFLTDDYIDRALYEIEKALKSYY
jgi:hypothetical protein